MPDSAIEDLVTGFANGWFPVDDADGLHWETANPRGVLFPDRLHVTSSARRAIRLARFEARIDERFDDVVRACATNHPDSRRVWLTPRVEKIYRRLFDAGHASCTAVCDGDRLVGGTFGIRIGPLCSIDSLFHIESGAGNVAFVAALRHAIETGALVCDVQRPSPHFVSFGAVPLPLPEYRALLAKLGLR